MSSLDMALDDIVKKNRPRVSRSSPPVGKGKHLAHNKPKSNPHTQTSTGPVRHQKRNTAPKTPYQKSFVVPSPFVSQSSFIPPVVGGVQLAFAPSHAAKWTHDLYQGGADKSKVEPTPAPVKKIQGDTVHVSNLAPDVTDDDVKEIFQEIGPVKSCTVNYNASGQSTGTATVVFVRKADAERAVAEFDEAEVDGRVMKLLLVGSVVTAPVVVKKSKPQVVQAAPQPQPIAFIPQPIQFQQQFQQPKQQQQQFRQPKVQQQQQQKKPQPQQQQPQRGGKVQRGGRGGSAPSRGARPQKTPATAEDLDKEMENYHTAAAPPSSAAAGQPVSV